MEDHGQGRRNDLQISGSDALRCGYMNSGVTRRLDMWPMKYWLLSGEEGDCKLDVTMAEPSLDIVEYLTRSDNGRYVRLNSIMGFLNAAGT